MSLLRCLTAWGAALALVVGLSAPSLAADGKAKKKAQAVRGVVSVVEQDKDKTGGSVTVKLMLNKKQAQAAAATDAVEEKFTVTRETKFEKVSGPKDAPERTPAKFADVQPGSVLLLTVKDGNVVEKVEVRAGKKNK